MTRYSSLSEPVPCRSFVFRNTTAILIAKAKKILCFTVGLFSSKPQPVNRFFVVLPSTLTIVIANTKIHLYFRIASNGSLFEQWKSFFIILFNKLSKSLQQQKQQQNDEPRQDNLNELLASLGIPVSEKPAEHGIRPQTMTRPAYLSICRNFRTNSMSRDDIRRMSVIWRINRKDFQADMNRTLLWLFAHTLLHTCP